MTRQFITQNKERFNLNFNLFLIIIDAYEISTSTYSLSHQYWGLSPPVDLHDETTIFTEESLSLGVIIEHCLRFGANLPAQ